MQGGSKGQVGGVLSAGRQQGAGTRGAEWREAARGSVGQVVGVQRAGRQCGASRRGAWGWEAVWGK